MTDKIKKDSVYLFEEIFKSLDGNLLYTSINDFTVAVGGGAPATGSKTLTITGLGTGGLTLTPESVLGGGNVQKIDAHGNVWNIPLTNIVVVSASVTFEDFEGRFFSDDSILVVLAGPAAATGSVINNASDVVFSAYLTITSINVQDAIAELKDEVDLHFIHVVTTASSGTTTVDTFTDTLGAACTWDVYVASGTAWRTSSIKAGWDAVNDTIADSGEYGIVGLGDTNPVSFDVVIAANNINLNAIVTTGTWTVRLLRHLL